MFIFEAGTGLISLGDFLRSNQIKRSSVIFSQHTWDRIQGIPFCKALYNPDLELDCYSELTPTSNLNDLLKRQMDYDFFPISISDFRCTMRFHNISDPNLRLKIGSETELTLFSSMTAQPSSSWRLRCGNLTLFYATSIDWNSVNETSKLWQVLQAGADLLIISPPRSNQSEDISKYISQISSLYREADINSTVISDFGPLWSDNMLDKLGMQLQSLLSKDIKIAHQNLRIEL